MWFQTKNDLSLAPEKGVNFYTFPFSGARPVLGQDEGPFEGLVNLVQW